MEDKCIEYKPVNYKDLREDDDSGQYSEDWRNEIERHKYLLDSGAKRLYDIKADYRKLNPQITSYYVLAGSKKEAKMVFKDHFNYMTVDSCEVVDFNRARQIVSFPMFYIILE